MSSNHCVLAIDPGYDRIGWAVGTAKNRNASIIDFGCITTKKNEQLVNRYKMFEQDLQTIISKFNPSVLASETLFFSVNKTSALKVAEARGIIISCCLRNKMDIAEYNPGTVKLAVTGNGKADKKAVEKMVRLQMKLPNEKIIDDAIDALAILLTHAIVSV